jgi:hypothetical protein
MSKEHPLILDRVLWGIAADVVAARRKKARAIESLRFLLAREPIPPDWTDEVRELVTAERVWIDANRICEHAAAMHGEQK